MSKCAYYRYKEKIWIYKNLILHGEYSWSFFEKWDGFAFGFHSPEYYDGYHFAINLYVVNLYIYW